MFVRARSGRPVRTLAQPHRRGRAGFDFLFLACIKASSSSRRCGNVERRVLCGFPHFHNEPGQRPPWVRFGFYPFYRVLLALPAQWAIPPFSIGGLAAVGPAKVAPLLAASNKLRSIVDGFGVSFL